MDVSSVFSACLHVKSFIACKRLTLFFFLLVEKHGKVRGMILIVSCGMTSLKVTFIISFELLS